MSKPKKRHDFVCKNCGKIDYDVKLIRSIEKQYYPIWKEKKHFLSRKSYSVMTDEKQSIEVHVYKFVCSLCKNEQVILEENIKS